MTNLLALCASHAPVPAELTNTKSKLLTLGDAAMTLKESIPDKKTVWKRAVVEFQTKVREICPMYEHYRGESFGMTCDSGSDGVYFRGEGCLGCKLLDCNNIPGVRHKNNDPVYQAPEGYVLVKRAHIEKLIQIS